MSFIFVKQIEGKNKTPFMADAVNYIQPTEYGCDIHLIGGHIIKTKEGLSKVYKKINKHINK